MTAETRPTIDEIRTIQRVADWLNGVAPLTSPEVRVLGAKLDTIAGKYWSHVADQAEIAAARVQEGE